MLRVKPQPPPSHFLEKLIESSSGEFYQKEQQSQQLLSSLNTKYANACQRYFKRNPNKLTPSIGPNDAELLDKIQAAYGDYILLDEERHPISKLNALSICEGPLDRDSLLEKWRELKEKTARLDQIMNIFYQTIADLRSEAPPKRQLINLLSRLEGIYSRFQYDREYLLAHPLPRQVRKTRSR